MFVSTLEDLLFYYCIAIAFVLAVAGFVLRKKGLFNPTTAGFWSWCAFFLFFLVNPLSSLWTENVTALYGVRLYYIGGLSRAEWISFVSIIAIIIFFVVYLNDPRIKERFSEVCQPPTFMLPVISILVGFIGFSFFSLLKFRTDILQSTQSAVIENGRFTGEVTGYEQVGHSFIFIPVIYLLSSNNRFHRLLGWLTGLVFVGFRMLDAWDRFTAVSLLLAMVLASVIRQKKTRLPIIPIFLVFIIGGVLQIRGHSRIESIDQFGTMATQIPETILAGLAGGDTAMLPTWYVNSYINDKITGYDWGIPVTNYVLLGFIPARFFPDKYFLIDWWNASHPLISTELARLMSGAKSSLFGSFYSHGGIVAVLIGSILMGIFCKKLDLIVTSGNPLLKTLGITWLSVLWMVWGSSTTWGIMLLGTLSIPAIVFYIASKMKPKSPVHYYSVNNQIIHYNHQIPHRILFKGDSNNALK